MEWRREDGYAVSDDPALPDLDLVHGYLAGESYWARGIPREVVERSVRNSLCFTLLAPDFEGRKQAGFCRAVTDRATFAYLADVFVLPEHRGRGLGKWLVSRVLEHPELQGLRRWMLATSTAHGLYSRYGFEPVSDPAVFMEILRPYKP